MRSTASMLLALSGILIGCAAFGYATLVGTQNPTQSVIVLGLMPLGGIVAAWGSSRARWNVVAVASAVFAVVSIPAAIAVVYLRSGV